MQRVDGQRVPVPSLVVLVGASGSGKSTWAATTFGGRSVVCADDLRAIAGEGPGDQFASDDAFDLLDRAVRARLTRSLTTVIDTTGLDVDRRRGWLEAGRRAGLPVFVVVFDVPGSVCKARNRARERRVPESVIAAQSRTLRAQRDTIEQEGWDDVLVVDDRTVPATPVASAVAQTAAAAGAQSTDPVGLRFGLHLSRFALAGGPARFRETIRDLAVQAEAVGFSSFWVMDHALQIPQVGRAWDPILEPFPTLAHVAAHTESMTVGTLVAGVTHRPVTELGRAMAALDVLSGGRAVCGLGAAWYAKEYESLGRALPPLSERFALLEDAAQLLPLLWGPGSKSFDGHVLQVPEATCYPRPLRGSIPLLIGGQGERRTLRIAARWGDACNLFGEPDAVAAKLDVLRDHCRAVDRDPGDLRVTHLSTSLVGRDDREVETLVEQRAPARGRDRWRAQVHAGTVRDQVGRFRALAEVGVEEAIVVLEDVEDATSLERFAPVIDAFSGSVGAS